jgi:hypothetical protein
VAFGTFEDLYLNRLGYGLCDHCSG